jgi:TolB-like protein
VVGQDLRGPVIVPIDGNVFSFGDYTLDLRRGRLRHGERDVELRPKCFQVLRYLVENPGQLIGKDALMSAVWPNVIVADEAVSRCISEVRLALGDDGSRLIKTVPRRGYLLEARVVSMRDPSRSQLISGPSPSMRVTHAHGDEAPRLSIAILPFVDLGGDMTHANFTDAITEALTTDLSRLRGAVVTGRSTVFGYRGKEIDAREIGSHLRVRFIVEGSLQTVKDRIRVYAKLLDSATGMTLWAHRFDLQWSDPLYMQDLITARLSRAIGLKLIAAESARVERERASSIEAFDLTIRGNAIWNRVPSLQRARKARAYFEAALRLDDRDVGALVGVAKANIFEVNYFGSANPEEQIMAAKAAVLKALTISPESISARMCRAHLLCLLGEPEQALWEHVTADGDDSRPSAHALLGSLKLFLGRAEETESHVIAAMRLSPGDHWSGQWHFYLGAADLYLCKFNRAIEHLRRAVAVNPFVGLYHVYLAAALAMAGRLEQARDLANSGRQLLPDLRIGQFRTGIPSSNKIFLAQREQITEGMRRAGIPE